MRAFGDTIVACITGSAKAAVAVVRLSGPSAWEIAFRVCPSVGLHPVPRVAQYGTFVTGEDGLVLPFQEGHSYTGEQTAELMIHGSRAGVRQILGFCLECGAREAEPGEFTYRAFLNGRLDLTQAEGVRETVEAETAQQFREAQRLRSGDLYRSVGSLVDRIGRSLAAVEASVDFSEEIGELDQLGFRTGISEAVDEIRGLLSGARRNRMLHEGFTIVLCGRPNAGKSSLFNVLLRSNQAIVTPIPGTTTDALEARIEMDGYLVRLVDTAGLREADGEIEKLGIERTKVWISAADLILYLYDASLGLSHDEHEEIAQIPCEHLLIATKSDLIPSRTTLGMPVSTVSNQGINDLEEQIAKRLRENEGSLVIGARHETQLRKVETALGNVLATLDQGAPDDLLCVDLRVALNALGEITGQTASADVLESIFRDFCIGK